MCDNPNTTDISETECRFCLTVADCNVFRRSFIHPCNYYTIPNRYDEWGNQDGLCTDDLDILSVSLAPWVLIIGWALLMFGIGLIRKERGDYASLRRHGVRVNADVLERSMADSELVTAPSMPNLTTVRYYVTATWLLDPSRWGSQTYCRGRAIWQRIRAPCRRRKGQPAFDGAWEQYRVHASNLRGSKKGSSSSLMRTRSSDDASGAGSLDDAPPWGETAGLARTVSFADADVGKTDSSQQLHRVEKKIQCTFDDWERVVKQHMVIRLMYDPMIGGSVMPMSGVVGQATSRLLLWAISACMGGAIIAMGLAMVIETFHCGQHFWGRESCCDVCHDWDDFGPDRAQKCYRGACDGLGGRTHMYWCEASCDVTWALLPIPCAMGVYLWRSPGCSCGIVGRL